MKKLFPNIIFLFLLMFAYEVKSQVSCTTPESPVLTLVSLDPETGNVQLNWDLSPSDSIAAYVLYTYNNGAGLPFPDTLWNSSATSYSYNTPATGYFSVSYVVAAHRLPDCTSPLSNHLNTIFAESQIDTCNKKITISWNKYLSEPKKVTGYNIISSVNGGAYTTVAVTGEDKVSFILENFLTDSEYCFVVIASLEDGTTSKSNKSCLSTKMQRPPEWINADYATVKDNKILLSFTIDPQSEISNFSLERKTGSSGSFAEIAKIAASNEVVNYEDNKADIRNINVYRLSAINSCNNPITISNLASNIVLRLERVNSDILLKWNHYKDWLGSVSTYRLHMNSGDGYLELTMINPSDSAYLVHYKDIMYNISKGEVCFELSADETSNPHGITGNSVSQPACSETEEVITVPDVFTPNNDLINDLFRPVLSFTPVEYNLIISDRQGKRLFETKSYNESWDGSNDGDPVPQGVYLWYLRIVTPSLKTISRTGTITVYFNR